MNARRVHVYPRKLSGQRRRFSYIENGVRKWHAHVPSDTPQGKSLRGMVMP